MRLDHVARGDTMLVPVGKRASSRVRERIVSHLVAESNTTSPERSGWATRGNMSYKAFPLESQGEKKMKVYLGYSLDKSADQILDWLDIDPSHPEGTSVFERMFGCGYIRPGDFEVYGIEDMEHGFSVSEIKECFPFEMGELNLWKADLRAATCVFWIKSESDLQAREAEEVTICDKLEVDKFFFEHDSAQ